MWFLDQCLTDHRSILKHIFQIDQITVMFSLCKIIGIMEMDNSLFMCSYDLLRKKYTAGKILTYFSSHVITLGRIDHRVLIGIFLVDLFVDIIKQ